MDANGLGFIMEEPTNKVTNPIIWLMRHAAPNSRSAFSKPSNVTIMVYHSQLGPPVESATRNHDTPKSPSVSFEGEQASVLLEVILHCPGGH